MHTHREEPPPPTHTLLIQIQAYNTKLITFHVLTSIGKIWPLEREGSISVQNSFNCICSSLSSFCVCTSDIMPQLSWQCIWLYAHTNIHKKRNPTVIAISSIQTLPATPSYASGYKCAKPLLHPLTHPLFSSCVQLHCWAFQLIHTKAITMSYTARGRERERERERERVLLNMSSLNKKAPSIDFVFMQWCHSFQLGWHEG